MKPKPLVLCILDGWGNGEGGDYDAIAQADTPNWDRLSTQYPRTELVTCGLNVGLPEGQMGNSEVGHMNIGAGRVVKQFLPRIDEAISDGSIKLNPVLKDLIAALKASGGTCHVMGLLSDGGVHAHGDHIRALIDILKDQGVPVALHAFTDGRDTPPKMAADYIADFEPATICGRYYAMDRDNRWERVEKAYNAIVHGRSVPIEDNTFLTGKDYIKSNYNQNITDEFIEPGVHESYTGMKDGDAVLFANFRGDRAREILSALLEPAFKEFPTQPVKFCAAAGIVEYSDELNEHMQTLFPPETYSQILGEVLADRGYKQLRMAETEKYPHVTYFFNCGREEPFENEARIMVNSPKVATYDLQPEMSAPELTEKCVAEIESGRHDVIIINFANPDMVGHTGVLEAVIKAVETVDEGIGRIYEAVKAQGGALILTADHGNADQLWDDSTNGPHTAHTLNPVPFVVCNAGDITLQPGRLADIAPTMLSLLGEEQPDEMGGECLI